MLESIIVILIIMWLLGWVMLPAVGSMIHLLLIVVLVVVVLRLLRGRGSVI